VVKLELRDFNTTEETTTMSKDTRTLGKIVQIDDARIQDRVERPLADGFLAEFQY